MPQANSTTSSPRWMSPRASGSVLPCSDESSLARLSYSFCTSSRNLNITRARRCGLGSQYNIGMMQAILVGQSYQLQKVWTEDYRSTGTFHALVISGTHVAILAAFFLFVLRLCFVPEQAALVVTVAAAWLYALVTGFNAPCVRSAAALTLVIAAGYFFRERRPLNLLAAVALGFLLFD